MRNFYGKGKELTEVVNGESVLFTKSSRSLDTRPLRAFIITSICSFIACISATIGGGAISIRDGRLRFCRSGLLGVLCPMAFLVPFVRNCLLDFPLGHCVLHSFDIAVLPDHGSIS